MLSGCGGSVTQTSARCGKWNPGGITPTISYGRVSIETTFPSAAAADP